MMRRYGFLVMAAVLLLAGCREGDAGSAKQTAELASGETFTPRIGNTASDIGPFNIAYREFEEEVEKASEGRIQAGPFTSGPIDEMDTDVLDKTHSNILQVGDTTPNCFADLSGMSEYYVYGIPCLMFTDEELNAVVESEWFMGLNKDFTKATGIKVLDSGINMGWFGSSITGREVHRIVDLEGMAIRINQTNQMTTLSESTRISSQFTVFSKMYTALTQGTTSGMVTNAPLFYSNGFCDQLKSILTTHCRGSYHPYIINDKPHNSLPDGLKPIMDKNVDKLIARTKESEMDYLEEAVGKMREKNIIVTEASKEDEDMLRQISMDKVWWDENISLILKGNVKKVLETLDCTDGAQ